MTNEEYRKQFDEAYGYYVDFTDDIPADEVLDFIAKKWGERIAAHVRTYARGRMNQYFT